MSSLDKEVKANSIDTQRPLTNTQDKKDDEEDASKVPTIVGDKE